MNFALDQISLHKIPDVEIFRTGTWNGETYVKEDLVEMQTNFNRFKKDNPNFQLPLKLGHTQDDREPAVGWMDNIRVSGDRLYADLVDLPETIYNLVRLKGYKNRSIELIEKYGCNGKVVGKMIRGMALLGSSLPAVNLRDVENGVAGLSKLGKALYGKHFSEADDFITLEFAEEETMEEEVMVDAPKEEIVEEKVEQVEPEAPVTPVEPEKPEVENMQDTSELDAMKSKIAEMEAKLNELMGINTTLSSEVAEYKAKDEQLQYKAKEDYVLSLIESERILPAQRESVFALLDAMDEKEIKLNFSDGSEKVTSKVNLFKDILDSLPSSGITKRESNVEAVLDYTGAVNKFSQDTYQKDYKELTADETRTIINKMGADSRYSHFIK